MIQVKENVLLGYGGTHIIEVRNEGEQAIFPIGGGITKSTLYNAYKGVGIC